jgi:hypothetical protein
MNLSELKALNKRQLHDLFLKINQLYMEATSRPFREYVHNPDFMRIEQQLMDVIAELRRRRRN